MKKSVFALTTLCVALSLTACGGSDSSSNGDTNPNNSTNPTSPTNPTNPANTNSPIQNGMLSYTDFDAYSDKANKTAWGRMDYTFENGSMTEIISTVIGASSFGDYFNGNDEDVNFTAGKGFFSAIKETEYNQVLGKSVKMIDGDTLQASYPNTPLTQYMDIKSFDISGKGKNITNRTTGFITELDNNLEYFKAINYSFPQGSQCYVINSKTNLPTYYFQTTLVGYNQSTLQEWVTSQQNIETIELNGKSEKLRANDIVYENIGNNNEIPAVHFKDQLGNYHAAVSFNRMIIDAGYSDGINYETPVENTDPTKGPIECGSYNKTAADYLAEQMKASYPLQ